MIRSRFALIAGLLTVGAASSQAAWFFNEGDFLNAIQASYYAEDFGGYTGSEGSIGGSYTGTLTNGFNFSATPSFGDLFAVSGGIRTSNNAAALSWGNFVGSPTAFGGYFGTYRNSTSPGLIAGEVTMSVWDGTSNQIESASTPTGSTVFIGWVGNFVLSSNNTSITGNFQSESDSVMADKVWLGKQATNAVPEPFTMGLGLAAAGVFVRRRMKK